MKLEDKGIFKILFYFLLAIGLSCLGSVFGKVLYLDPFFIKNIDKVFTDSLFIQSFYFGAGVGLFIFAPINFAFRVFRKRELSGITMLIFVGSFSVAAFITNIAVYQYVIKPREMILCPPEPGYKRNILRLYVTDLSLCKSD